MKKAGQIFSVRRIFTLVVVFVVVFSDRAQFPKNEKTLKLLRFKAFYWS